MVEPEKKEPEKVDAELNIEPEKKEPEVPDEKAELLAEVEKLRNENQVIRSEIGRSQALETKLNSLESGMDEKIKNLLSERQATPTTEDVTTIDDDDYVTGKKLKEIVGSEVKRATGNQEEAVEKILTAREEKSKKWNGDYMKEVAKQSMDISEDETLQGILGEMDAHFRDDSIRDPKIAAELNYSRAKASYVTKAMSAGKQIKFGSGKAPIAPLGVGGGLNEKVFTREEPEIKMPEDAKELLAKLEPDVEKRKALAKEALG